MKHVGPYITEAQLKNEVYKAMKKIFRTEPQYFAGEWEIPDLYMGDDLKDSIKKLENELGEYYEVNWNQQAQKGQKLSVSVKAKPLKFISGVSSIQSKIEKALKKNFPEYDLKVEPGWNGFRVSLGSLNSVFPMNFDEIVAKVDKRKPNPFKGKGQTQAYSIADWMKILKALK